MYTVNLKSNVKVEEIHEKDILDLSGSLYTGELLYFIRSSFDVISIITDNVLQTAQVIVKNIPNHGHFEHLRRNVSHSVSHTYTFYYFILL